MRVYRFAQPEPWPLRGARAVAAHYTRAAAAHYLDLRYSFFRLLVEVCSSTASEKLTLCQLYTAPLAIHRTLGNLLQRLVVAAASVL